MNAAGLLRRVRAPNLALQAIGPLSGFFTVLVIARMGGAAAQGEFAQTKAWVELLVVVGCFGFPQSFVYVIHRLGASARRLALLSAAYSLAFLPLAWGMTLAALAFGGARLGGDSLAQLALALSAALFVLHGLWRGVFLTTGREMWFAAFSILPPVSLFGSVLAGMASGHGHFAALFVLSAAASVAVALVLMRPVLRPLQPEASGAGSVPWKALLANGAHAFMQALLLVVQPLLAYGLIRSQGGGNPQIGLFNVGVFLVQGLSVPITMVSPLLFAHWTSTDDASRMARLHAATPRGLAAGMALGLLLAAASLWGVPLLFGASYAAAAPLAAVMMLALPLTCHGRLISPALHAHDRPMANSVAGVLRLASLAFAACGLMAAGADVLMAVAVGWSFSELVASGWVLWLLRRFVREQRQRLVAGGD